MDTPFTAHEFQEKLLEEYGVACIAGTSFGGFGEGYVRLSCANSDEAIEEAVNRLASIKCCLTLPNKCAVLL